MVELPVFGMRDLVEHGVHYGHKTSYWNPQMASFIFGIDNGSHVIDLRKTFVLLKRALQAAAETASKGGKFLFLGTRPVIAEVVRQQAMRCSQYYMVFRWLGGTFTNWRTVSMSVKKMMDMKAEVESMGAESTKHERLRMRRKVEKLAAKLYGIKNMDSLPDMLIVFDVGNDGVAIKEAQKLGIPVIGIVDTNNSPKGIDYVIPANDDSSNSIYLISKLLADAIIAGSAARLERAPKDAQSTNSPRHNKHDKNQEEVVDDHGSKMVGEAQWR